MARTTLRALVFLACVVAFGCSGDSNPTNPDNPPSGGGGRHGWRRRWGRWHRATAIASDDVFDDNNWDAEVQTSEMAEAAVQATCATTVRKALTTDGQHHGQQCRGEWRGDSSGRVFHQAGTA